MLIPIYSFQPLTRTVFNMIIGYELPWMPTRVLGQAVFDRVKSLICRVADMHLGSHLVTGFAILE